MIYILLDNKNETLLNVVHNILEEASFYMKDKFNLSHWLPVYSLESVKKDSIFNMLFLVCNQRNEYISTFQVLIKEDNEGRFLYLRKVATRPRAMGNGVGTQIISYVKDLATKLRCNQVRLDVYDQSSQAISFYKKQDFKIYGEQKTRRFRVLLMKKEIK